MTTMTAAEVRRHFSDLVSRASYSKERITISRNGKAIAAIVPIEDLELIEELEDRIDIEEARAALAEARKKGTISLADFKKELGL